MGLRLRRSINLGGGFRINLSKSGIGYSWGMKGVRFTKTARGTARKTYSLPGTGLSYVEESGRKGSRTPGQNGGPNPAQSAAMDAVSTENVTIGDYQPAEYAALLTRLKKVQRTNLISNCLIASILFAGFPPFLVTGIAGILLKIFVRTRMKVPMEYTFDEEAKAAYEDLSAIWMSLNKNQKFWQTVSESKLEQRTNGGATRGLNRIRAKAINQLPFSVDSNIRPFGLKLRKQNVYFMPDKVLVVSPGNVGAISYSDLTMHFGTICFVERDSVPKDAKVVGQTWLRVNKNGTPDNRFKQNRQVPVCEYGEVLIQSNSGLHIELMCSNVETVQEMSEAAARFSAFLS